MKFLSESVTPQEQHRKAVEKLMFHRGKVLLRDNYNWVLHSLSCIWGVDVRLPALK